MKDSWDLKVMGWEPYISSSLINCTCMHNIHGIKYMNTHAYTHTHHRRIWTINKLTYSTQTWWGSLFTLTAYLLSPFFEWISAMLRKWERRCRCQRRCQSKIMWLKGRVRFAHGSWFHTDSWNHRVHKDKVKKIKYMTFCQLSQGPTWHLSGSMSVKWQGTILHI